MTDARLHDDELEGFLAERANPVRGDSDDVLRLVQARISVERQRELGWVTPKLLPGRRRIAWVASTAAALIVGIAIGLVGPSLLRTDSSPGSAPPPSSEASAGTIVDLARVLSPEVAGAALAEGRIPVGSTLLVDTALPPRPCPETGQCVDAARDGIPGAVVVIQPGVAAPDEGRAIRALRVTDLRHASGVRILDLVADDVRMGPDGAPWTVDALAPSAAPGSTHAVRGWLADLPPFRCPVNPGAADPPTIRVCGTVSSYLTPTAYQAARTDGSGIRVVPPDVAIGVANGDYRAFALDPADDEHRLSIPREGVYVVEIATPGALPVGRLLARIGAPEAAAGPSPSPSVPVSRQIELETLTPMALADGLETGRIVAEQVVLVEGRLVEDPRCPPVEPVGLCRYRMIDGVPDLLLTGGGYAPGEFVAPERSRFALEITRRVDEHGRRIAITISDTLVTDDATGGPHSVASLLTLPEDPVPDRYEGYLVGGWLVGAEDADCTDDPTSSAAYGCGNATWLTDDPESSFAPAIRLQNDAYRSFAPDPTAAGPTATPRRGMWLVVRQITRMCSSPGSCEVDIDQWALIRRVAAAPTDGAGEPPAAGLAITCEWLERDLCERLGSRTASYMPDAASVFVTYYSEACLRAMICPPASFGYQHRFMVAVTATDGSVTGWGCNENAFGPTCEAIAVADVVPLAEIRFEGLRDVAAVYLLPMDRSWSRGGQSQDVQPLPVGAYRIAAAAREKVQFASNEEFPFDGPMPPDWCALTLDAQPGVIYAVTITPVGGACTIEVVDTGLRRPD